MENRRRRGDGLTVQGTVREALPHALFAIALDDGQQILGHVATDLRTRALRIVPGDRVTVELSPYDRTRGRITVRHR